MKVEHGKVDNFELTIGWLIVIIALLTFNTGCVKRYSSCDEHGCMTLDFATGFEAGASASATDTISNVRAIQPGTGFSQEQK